MSSRRLLALLPLLLLGGCFPIELDVRDGKLLIPRDEGFFVFDPVSGKAAKVAGPDAGKPVFARFSPDGKEILTVVKGSGFNEFIFSVGPAGGGKGREIYKAENTAYVLYSPDGANLGIVQMSKQPDPQFKNQVPEFYLLPAKGGAAKKVAGKVGVLFRWFPDSKRVLIFELDKQDEMSHYFGSLSALDVTTGKATPLAAAAVAQQCHERFDAHPLPKVFASRSFSSVPILRIRGGLGGL
jgi:hypothetical protein